MSVVCVDTQILIWAIRGVGANEYKLTMAKEFMKLLDARKDRIIIPYIVVGEMLVPVEEWNIKQVVSQYKSDWRIAEYNMACAIQFAKMRRNHALEQRRISLQQVEKRTRAELIADVMIIATAIAYDADIIYSHDEPLRKLAKDWIEAKDFLDENLQFPMELPSSDE